MTDAIDRGPRLRNRPARRIPGAMLTAFALSLAQLGDPRILRVLAKSMALTLALFALLGAGVWWGVDALLATWAWHGAIASIATPIVTFLLFWLLFRAIAVLAVGLFADEIVAAVEARHYPAALATARDVPLHRSVRLGLGSAVRFVAVNLLLLVTFIGIPLVFLAANGWLLGRDLADMVAARHMDDAAMRAWRRTNRVRRFLLGLAATALFVVPLVNILAAVIGAAMATHFFHRGRS